MDENIQKAILEIRENIKQSKKYGYTMLLVESDHEKGYDYPYVLCYPSENMNNTLVMNCLNDYEEEIFPNETENIQAIEQIYSLFGEDRIASNSKSDIEEKVEEDKDKSLSRISKRLESATNKFGILVTSFPNSPIIRPLIPGFKTGESHENTASELGSGVAKKLAPQISAMIKNAQEIINEHTGIDLEDKIISFGHSKEATFADHFSVLNPEKIKALIIGGTEYSTLPIEEIRLIVDNNRGENERFKIQQGIPYKKVTQEELDEIIQEYNDNKKENQRDIRKNDDDSYSLPMNYPVGIADIEEYVGEFKEDGKEKYLKRYMEIPRVIFNGEDEEEVEGHYAYSLGETIDKRVKIKEGEDVARLENQGHLFEIEHASMHNRTLDYVSAQRVLFGRGDNERLRNYINLAELLKMNIQSKIYKTFSHHGIYRIGADINETLIKDLNSICSSLHERNEIPELDDNERSNRISPIHQLIRRCRVSKSKEEFDYKNKKWEEFIRKNKSDDRVTERENTIGRLERAIDDYICKKYDLGIEDINIDRIYDSLSTDELAKVFARAISTNEFQGKKSGLDDFFR